MNIMPERLLGVLLASLPPEIALTKVLFVHPQHLRQLFILFKLLLMLIYRLSFHSLVFRHLEN
jgi:hypothetical protein